ncbi:protein NPG1 [Brassica rapa]|uniref:protein NPG1 n=1 Tax=Brassica campestris TaxID=3711 RepID=UPI0004F16410|nr:protein NPG1 [Brassica rapa]XP_009133569.1 protein NPG1 [Brassica rapa]XP_033144313.1 protein NPG1 [Brassica rapa]XP_033144314.1 protein NPG1 [Brassica rapa]
MLENQSKELSENREDEITRQLCANGLFMKTTEVEAKLDEGNIQEAESSLREGLSLNSEEARALLGRLEYQRGNLEGALRLFEGIDLQAEIQRLQASAPPPEKPVTKKNRPREPQQQPVPQHAASLVLEAIYLKAKSLQKLGRTTEAARECKSVLDSVEKVFQQGISDAQVDTRLQETVSHAVELLPALFKDSGDYQEAISAYRRALLSQWNLDNDSCARIQKDFAVFLLHSGVEASPPSLASQVEGSYTPRNNLEEAILLLMILIKKFNSGKAKWDPSVIEHITFALSLCSQTSVVAKQLEEVMPGVFTRVERWNSLALCYSAAGQTSAAVNLLRKSLHKHEQPDDLVALLLAAKLCSEEPSLAAEGAGYAERGVKNAQGMDEHLKGVGLRMLGLCLGKQAKVPTSDFERSRLQSESLKALDGAIAFEHNNPDLIFELGVQYAEQRNLKAASRYAKEFIDATGGSVLKGWRFLALVLSAQQRFSEAEVVTDAALDETAKWDQGPLLRLKAKLKISQSNPTEAVETYRYLLALVQAQRKSFGPLRTLSQMEEDKVNEFEVWHGLAYLYSSLSHWNDVEVCLKKAGELKQYSASMLHTEGRMWEGRKEFKPALAAFLDGLLLDESSVPCKVAVGALLCERGKEYQPTLPVARSLLSDALRIDPTNRKAWYYLGMVHKHDGRITDATDCFQAASMLEESDPIESFSTIL